MSGNRIRVRSGGPLLCTGRIRLVSGAGERLQEGDDLVLCRCGASANKPFCDGSHEAAGFDAPGVVRDQKPEPLEGQGPLEIVVRPNAMLVAKGPMTLVGAESGETTRNKAALCRCGQSANKPFCDASHRRCGFRAE